MLREVLRIPEALPEMRGGTRDIAAAVIGAKVIPMPVPVTTSAGSNVRQLVVVDTRLVIRRIPPLPG